MEPARQPDPEPGQPFVSPARPFRVSATVVPRKRTVPRPGTGCFYRRRAETCTGVPRLVPQKRCWVEMSSTQLPARMLPACATLRRALVGRAGGSETPALRAVSRFRPWVFSQRRWSSFSAITGRSDTASRRLAKRGANTPSCSFYHSRPSATTSALGSSLLSSAPFSSGQRTGVAASRVSSRAVRLQRTPVRRRFPFRGRESAGRSECCGGIRGDPVCKSGGPAVLRTE